MDDTPTGVEALRAAQERITAFWDAVSDAYEGEPGNVPRPGSWEESAWIGALGELLPAPPADVLDVGTGTGFVARAVASLGYSVTGLDLSRNMLEVARARARQAGVAAQFVCGDAGAPDFPPASFDAVTNRSLIWTLLKFESALAAWRRLLRSGGRLVCVYGLADCGPGSTSPRRPQPESRSSFFDRHYTSETRELLAGMRLSEHEPLLAAITAAGFSDPVVRRLDVVHAPNRAPCRRPTH